MSFNLFKIVVTPLLVKQHDYKKTISGEVLCYLPLMSGVSASSSLQHIIQLTNFMHIVLLVVIFFFLRRRDLLFDISFIYLSVFQSSWFFAQLIQVFVCSCVFSFSLLKSPISKL